MKASSCANLLATIRGALALFFLVFGGSTLAAEAVQAAPAYRVFATGLDEPRGLLFAPNGSLYVAEQGSGSVARVDPSGKITRLARGLRAPHDLELDAAGNVLVAETSAGRISSINAAGVVTPLIADLEAPVDLAYGPDGRLWVCELTGKVRAFTPGGTSSLMAQLQGPHGLAFAKSGVVYINDWRGNRVVKWSQGEVRPFAEVSGPVGIAIAPSGDLYVTQPQAHQVSRIRPDGSTQTLITGLKEPRDPAFDRQGNLYIAETLAGRILVFPGPL